MTQAPKMYSPYAFRRMKYRGRFFMVSGSGLGWDFKAESLVVRVGDGHHLSHHIRSQRLEQILLVNVMKAGAFMDKFPAPEAWVRLQPSLGPLFEAMP